MSCGKNSHDAEGFHLEKVFSLLVVLMLVVQLGGTDVYADTSSQRTAFANEFIEAAEGEQWFLDEIERLLNMEQTSISQMAGVDDLKRITSLGIQGKNIEGKIPKAIGYLTNLKYLFASGNQLSGDLPEELYNLRDLINIDLSDNLYEGGIPTGLSKLTNLEVLRLSGNGYSGGIPLELTQLKKLRTLDLSGNFLTGGIPQEIAGLENLEFLELSCNSQLAGTLPESIAGMGKLTILSAWNCGLEGSILENIGDMTALKMIDLADNKLEGELPESLGQLVSLQELCLTDNLITGTVPDVFSGMNDLCAVHLDHNYLRGYVPDSLFNLFEEKISLGEELEITFAGNYMTGQNALSIEQELGNYVSDGNFVDDSAGQQYRLTGPAYLALDLNQTRDIFPQLRNMVASGRTSLPKPMRPFEEYIVEVDLTGLEDKISVTVDDGIWVTIKDEISIASAVSITVRIKDNDGSEYSKWTIGVGTEKISGGGGGGGSRSLPVSSQEEPEPDTENHLPYISGYEDGTVKPDTTVSREEAAVMLSRIISEEIPEAPIYSTFTDTEKTRWSAGYIDHVRKKKLLAGYPDSTFQPAEPMTRNEFAVLLCNLAGISPENDQPERFTLTDVSPDWAAGYVYAAFNGGHISGYEDHTFRGQRYVTRAEAAAMLNGALNRKPDTAYWDDNPQNPFSDLSEGHWAFYELLEAAITHDHEYQEYSGGTEN